VGSFAPFVPFAVMTAVQPPIGDSVRTAEHDGVLRMASRTRVPGWWLAAGCLAAVAFGVLRVPLVGAALTVETLRSIDALPPYITGQFREPAGFAEIHGGAFLVFDRRGHSVYHVDAQRRVVAAVVSVGGEAGRVLQPVAFAVGRDGTFVVADAPAGQERVQLFTGDGVRMRAFVMRGHVESRLLIGGLVLNGIGSLQYDGRRIYVNQPESGSLISAYSTDGIPERSIGRLRSTPYETSDPDLHLSFNTGLPIVNPRGGFYFVFQTGEPRFRKYDANGNFVFERVIQGRELDAWLAQQPTKWPARQRAGRDHPVVPPIVRTAAADAAGRLWVTFTLPYTYVFDEDGDKLRVVQFQAAGVLSPTSLSFASDHRVLVTPGCYIFDAGR
jgi:hypothetical protein